MLSLARRGDPTARGELFSRYINYLNILATTQLDAKLRRRVSPSDLVQETMLSAHRDFKDFRGDTQGELLGWLRKILIHSLHRAIARHVKADKRDVRREIPLEVISTGVEESAVTLANVLEATGQSPSQVVQAKEVAVGLSDQLAKLKPDYRDVIVYRILQGLSFEEVAARMNRSSAATRMLFLRAIDQFKTTFEQKPTSDG